MTAHDNWPELTEYLDLVEVDEPTTNISLDHLVDVLLPRAQRRVGQLWESSAWTVAQEHLATRAASKVVTSASSRYPRAPSRYESIISACADGEWHSLAADSLALSMEVAGWDVIRTRQSTQPPHVSSLIHDHGPRAVTISCSMTANLPGAYRMIRACLDTGTPVIVGGEGFGPDDTRARHLGATGWAPRFSEVRDLADGIRGGKNIRPQRDVTPVDYSLTAGPEVAARLSAALIDGSPRDVAPVTIGTWLLRTLRASILCDDHSIFDDHVSWQRGRSSSGADPALEPLLRAIYDAIPPAAETARSIVARHLSD